MNIDVFPRPQVELRADARIIWLATAAVALLAALLALAGHAAHALALGGDPLVRLSKSLGASAMTAKNVIVPAASDGWEDAARNAIKRVIVGLLLLFADWKWTTGKEKTPVPEGIVLAAIRTAAGWVRWDNGKPVEYIMNEDGQDLPVRRDLGNLDETQWEKGPDKKRKDPWVFSRFVYLLNQEDASLYTYSTSTIGGRQAVDELAGQISRMRLAHPGAVPLVELSAGPMQTQFGQKSKPIFKIVDWQLGASGEAHATRRLSPDDAYDYAPDND
jgi:hypothetical protein